jgi:hypothetical protein
VISNRAEDRIEGAAKEENMSEAPSSQQKIHQRRGRPKKNKEVGET